MTFLKSIFNSCCIQKPCLIELCYEEMFVYLYHKYVTYNPVWKKNNNIEMRIIVPVSPTFLCFFSVSVYSLQECCLQTLRSLVPRNKVDQLELTEHLKQDLHRLFRNSTLRRQNALPYS